MNVLMISIGDNILSNPIGDSLDRQKEYAKRLGYVDMIVYSPKKHNLNTKHYDNLSIYPSKSLNMFTFVYDVLKIVKKLLKNKKIDVITTQDPFGTALAGYLLKQKYKIPLHIQSHSSFLNNYEWINEKPILFRIFNKIGHFTLKKADRLRVVNTTEKQKYIDILGVKESKIDVAPVPINIKFWQIIPSNEELNEFKKKYNLEKPILSWVGRNVKFKNLEFLFKTLSLLETQYHILIAGDMKGYWNLEELEKKYNIKPIYLGILTHNELKILYYNTDIYLHTSNYEGFGLVVADAQASGCVVISRNTDGTKDIIEHTKSGFLVNNEEEFAEKIKFLLNNYTIKNSMSVYAKNMMAKKFSKDKMLNNIIESIKATV